MINELSVLFDIARSIAAVAFGATLLVAVALAIFDGRRRPAADEAKPERLRKAA